MSDNYQSNRTSDQTNERLKEIEWMCLCVSHVAVALMNVLCALEHRISLSCFRVCCDVRSVLLRCVFFSLCMLQVTCEWSSNVIREKRDRSHSHYPISHMHHTTYAHFSSSALFSVTFRRISAWFHIDCYDIVFGVRLHF